MFRSLNFPPIYVYVIYWTCPSFQLEMKVTLKYQNKSSWRMRTYRTNQSHSPQQWLFIPCIRDTKSLVSFHIWRLSNMCPASGRWTVKWTKALIKQEELLAWTVTIPSVFKNLLYPALSKTTNSDMHHLSNNARKVFHMLTWEYFLAKVTDTILEPRNYSFLPHRQLSKIN